MRKKGLVWSLGLLLCAIGTVALAETVTFKQGYTNALSGGSQYTNTVDTLIDMAATNKGAHVELGITFDWQRTLIDFGISSIPSGYVITNAVLRLNPCWYQAVDKVVGVYRITNSWDEMQATWTNRLTGTAWDTLGGDYNATLLDSAPITGYNWMEWDVTEVVSNWHANTYSQQGLLLKGLASGVNVYYFSSEHATSVQHPELVVDYVIPEPNAFLLLGMGISSLALIRLRKK